MSAVGTYLTDGTVTWIIEDATQADAVGDITLHPTLLPGHVLANGATVKASEYPRLLAWVLDNAMTGEDAAHYTYDESADTLKLPDAQGRFLQSGNALEVKEAGLPNITGGTLYATRYVNGVTGAFHYDNWYDHKIQSAEGHSDNYGIGTFSFDASQSNSIYGSSDTVQPPSITLIAQIKF